MLSTLSLSRHIRRMLVAACAIAMTALPATTSAGVVATESADSSAFVWTPTALPSVGAAALKSPKWDVAMSADGRRVFAIGTGLDGDDYVAIGAAGTIREDGSVHWISQQILQQQFAQLTDPVVVSAADGTRAVAVWLSELWPESGAHSMTIADIDWPADSPLWTVTSIEPPGWITCMCTRQEVHYPVLAVSPDGRHVSVAYFGLYNPNHGGHIMTATRQDAGLEWSDPVAIPEGPRFANWREGSNPVVFSEDARAIHALSGSYTSRLTVTSGQYREGSWKWSPPASLSGNVREVTGASISTDAQGRNVLATWDASTAEGHFAQVATTSDGGASWSTARNLTSRSRFQQLSIPVMSASGNGGVIGLKRRNSADGVQSAQIVPFTTAGGQFAFRGPIQLSPWVYDDGRDDNVSAPRAAVTSDGKRAPLTWMVGNNLHAASFHATDDTVSGEVYESLPFGVPREVMVSADGSVALQLISYGYYKDLWYLATGRWASVPGTPRSVTVTPQVASIRASWQAPTSDGGATITEYTATASPGGASCSTSALTCTIEGLTPGTPYSVSVVARNALGAGELSEPSAQVVPLAPPPPPPPPPVVVKDLVVTAGKRSVAARWTPPAGVPVSRFEVRLRGDKSWKSTAMRTSVTFQGLRPGRAVVVQVRVCGPADCAPPVSSKAVKPKR